MAKGTRYTPEFKAKAVRLLTESRGSYSSETKAIEQAARDLGVAPETLREAARVLTADGRFVIAGLTAQVEHPLLRWLIRPIYGDVRDGVLGYFERVAAPAGFRVSVKVEPARWVQMPVVVLYKDAGRQRQDNDSSA